MTESGKLRQMVEVPSHHAIVPMDKGVILKYSEPQKCCHWDIFNIDDGASL